MASFRRRCPSGVLDHLRDATVVPIVLPYQLDFRTLDGAKQSPTTRPYHVLQGNASCAHDAPQSIAESTSLNAGDRLVDSLADPEGTEGILEIREGREGAHLTSCEEGAGDSSGGGPAIISLYRASITSSCVAPCTERA